jgi:hypothetical protein
MPSFLRDLPADEASGLAEVLVARSILVRYV